MSRVVMEMKNINRISAMLATIKEITVDLDEEYDEFNDPFDFKRKNKYDSIIEQLQYAHYYLADVIEMIGVDEQ